MQRKKMFLYGAIIVLGLIADQLSKYVVLRHVQYLERIAVIPGFFDLTLAYNPGAAFSFLADAGGWQKFFFMGLALVICIYLLRAIIRDEFGTMGKIAAALVIGGATGNVVDRIVHGHVVDFLLLYYHNWFYPAFNVADSLISVGAVLLVLESIFHQKKKAV
ncbi:signal peptidase II [Snodgrassella gandavensis]|uniref:signal peptidase II n=1 Tax=Snodgrassella gandavensis TaxID=2946698 RepID=UPI001EF6A640|nr:signal peptidase II [Snodgrassella gandavensis]